MRGEDVQQTMSCKLCLANYVLCIALSGPVCVVVTYWYVTLFLVLASVICAACCELCPRLGLRVVCHMPPHGS